MLKIVLLFRCLVTKGVDMDHTLSLACTDGGLQHDKWREQGGCPAANTLLQVLKTQCNHTLFSYAQEAGSFSNIHIM